MLIFVLNTEVRVDSQERPQTNMSGAVRLFVVAGLLVALTALVMSGAADRFDLWVLLVFGKLQSPSTLLFWRYATLLGAPVAIVASAVLIVLFLVVQKQSADAMRIALIMLAASVLDMPFKYLVHRPRPVEIIAGSMPDSFSFPSGHVLFATAIYVGIACVVRRNLVWGAAGLLIVMVAFSRLGLGVHYPTDILGGFLAGLFCVGLGNVMSRKTAVPAA